MRQLELEVVVPEVEAGRLGQAAARQQVSLSELLSAAAAAYARRNAGTATSRGQEGPRKPIPWGARPAPSGEEESVHVVLGPEVLDLVEAVRRRVRWEEADGSTLPVTLEEYVLGATGRLIRSPRDAERLAGELFPGRLGTLPLPPSSPAGATAKPAAMETGWTPVRWVLAGTGAITVVSLVTALFLVVRARGRAVAAVDPSPAASNRPFAVPDGPDAGVAGDAIARWELQAQHMPEESERPSAISGPGRVHTQEIDKLLKSHLDRGRRDAAYDQAIEVAVRDVAELYPVTPALVKAIIRRESDFNAKARSRVGAIGLMQLMPFNAPKVGLREPDLWIPERNILGGTRLIAALLRYYNGDMVAALAAYNAKPRNPFAPLPRNGETPEYVAAVLRYYDEYTRGGTNGLGSRLGSP